jgi:aminotransferase
MKARTITLNGFSKAYAMTGWRVGYLAAPRDFVRRLTEPRHTLSINAATPVAVRRPGGARGAAGAGGRDGGRVRAPPRLPHAGAARPRPQLRLPGGAFYIYLNVSSSGLGAAEFCLQLLQRARVMLFPGALFGDDSDHYVRIGYLQPMARLEEAMDRLAAFLADVRVRA